MSRLTRSRFAALVREHHAAVFAAARRVLRRDADAEDVTQQVYLRALEQPDAVGAAEQPRALLLTMARRLACNWLRDQGRRSQHEERSPMAENIPDPAGAAAAADEQFHLRRELDALPDDLRAPLVLRFSDNLSFAAVGAALDIGESTAFERVQRGLVRLRERLTRAGLAGLALRLESSLALPATVGVPGGLQAALLGLFPAGIAASSAALVALLVLVLGAATWLGLGAMASGPDGGAVAITQGGLGAPGAATPAAVASGALATQDPPRREPVAGGAPGTQPAPAPSAGQPASRLAGAQLEGRVQQALGGPLAGWTVTATSYEYRGKEPLFRAAATTDLNGRFVLELPVVDATGTAYRLSTRMPDAPRAPLYQHAPRLLALPGERLPFLDLVLGDEYVPRAGAFEVLVAVVDAQARPVAGARVALRNAGARERYEDWVPEVVVDTDAAGRATLRGSRLGRKTLCVDARRQGHALTLRTLDLAAAGRSELEITLQAGVTLTGRLRRVDGKPLSPNAGVRLVDEAAGEPYDAHATIAADGSFTCAGLAPRPHRLDVVVQGCSPIRRRDVVPGGAPLELLLKASDDPQDHGDHWGEIHGEVRDAITGASVAVSVWDVERHWLAADERPDLQRDFVPDLVHARSAQKEAGEPVPEPSPRFHCVDLGPGTWLLEVRAKGYAPAYAGPFELGAGQLRSGVVVELRRGATVQGVVRDPAGKPVADAVVFLAGEGPRAERKIADQDEAVATSAGRHTIWLDGETRSDAAGRFTLAHVPVGVPLRVVASHPAWQPAAAAARTFADAGTATVDLRCVSQR